MWVGARDGANVPAGVAEALCLVKFALVRSSVCGYVVCVPWVRVRVCVPACVCVRVCVFAPLCSGSCVCVCLCDVFMCGAQPAIIAATPAMTTTKPQSRYAILTRSYNSSFSSYDDRCTRYNYS